MFNVDFGKLAPQTTPTILRQARFVAWIRALITGLEDLYTRFISARNNDLLRESIDSTVPRLEYILNFYFYPAGLTTDYDGRIKIETIYSTEPLYIYLAGITQPANENKPVYLPQFIRSYAETDSSEANFVIHVPSAALPYNVARMRSLIRTYALPDKTFIIKNI